ncbi:lipocalin family protein [Xanthomarina gelatinilytica]|uniref:lipocalin family protein n=1 Tax=Xanthomarina gelatinilytica TaxID=1137281 RepID=UPI003AA90E83
MNTHINNYRLYLVVTLVTLFISCSSDDESPEPIPEPTTAELLANKWYFVKVVDNTTTPPTETILDDCQQNGYLEFMDEGSLVQEQFYLDGSSCTSSGMDNLTYILSEDESQISMTFENNSTTIALIDVLTETELVITSYDGKNEIHFVR